MDGPGEHVDDGSVATTDVGRNWSGNVAYSARRLLEPESLDELRGLVSASSRLRPHGTGDEHRVVAASVAAVEFVTADGDLMTLRRGDEDFEGVVVALGSLGVVTALTLDIRPRYEIRQLVHLGLPGDAAIEHVTELL